MAVIVACLALQAAVVVQPRGARWWPFVDYPMYARSASEGDVVRVRELRARTCDAAPRAWAVASQTLGEQGSRFHSELSVIAADRPAARRLRARFSRVAGERLAPRPCALQVWERTVVLTASGADQVRWAPLREWLVARPDSVIRFPAP